jgi:hypothetical protein
VSGEPTVHLPGSAMLPLIRAAARLAAVDLGAFAVIGGVAVTARLGRAHRATTDLDTVVDDDLPPSAIEVLSHLDGATPDEAKPHRVYIDGTKVEVIGTGALTEADLDGLDDRQILFVAGHRWALEAATPVTLMGDDNSEATLPLARPSALVAMKLHAIQDRRLVGGIDKRGGDAWDIYRLLTDLDIETIAAELRSTMPPLLRVVAAAATDILVERAGRTRGWLRTGDAEMASVRAEDLEAAGMDLLRRLAVGR